MTSWTRQIGCRGVEEVGTKAVAWATGGVAGRGVFGENQELRRREAAVGTRRRGRIWRNCFGTCCISGVS